MIGTVIDGIAALYVGVGIWQGRRRKLSGELGRLVGVVVASLFGFGAFKGLGHLTGTNRLGIVGAFIVGVIGVKLIRRTLARAGRHATRDFLDRTLSEKADRLWGTVAGGGRSLLLAVVGVGAAYLAPFEGVHQTLQEDSLLGRVVGMVVTETETP